MNRNISIVVVILVLVVIAGYLVWLRSKVQPTVFPSLLEQGQVTPSPEATLIATSSAVPGAKEATGAVKQRPATPGAVRR